MIFRGRRTWCVLFVLLLAFQAHASSHTDPNWQNRRWLQKTVRLLRGGEGLLPSEDADALLRLPREQVVAQLMSEPRFSNMVLDFNMYMLGFKIDRLKSGDQLSAEVFNFPNALESAREVAKDGDYFKVFDLQAKAYLPPLQVYRNSGEENIPLEDLLRTRAEAAQEGLRDIIEYALKDPSATVGSVCNRYQFSRNITFELGLPFIFTLVSQSDWNFAATLDTICFLGFPSTPQLMAGHLQRVLDIQTKLWPAILPLGNPSYAPRLAEEALAIDPQAIGLAAPWLSYGVSQRLALPNSSTNFNRKRAAYVLKHFFCDDLTPIAVENPQEHTKGPHGSQTSCYACHYKLDPMAGFFRDYGFTFGHFEGQTKMVFDDLAVVDRAAYLENWKARPGAGRVWNVGYVRSINDESLNDYGETLEDLHALLRRAPEVKRCISRRLFEYMVSDKQTIDAGYLDYLAEEFERRAQVNSAQAFKWMVSTLALSQSFSQPDLQADQCYDHRPGQVPGDRPPCRVAFIFERNCATCHSSVNGAGRLNLKGWITLPDGKKTFPHLDRNGQQQPAHVTFERLTERLTSPDENRRMPLGSFMSSQDRQELYLWVQEQLQ